MAGLLQVRGLNKAYGGVQALMNLSFSVASGTITALVGPNGAGKTTCFNTISGVVRPDSGEILFKEQPVHRLQPHEIGARGIGRTFQQVRLFSNMTVLQNVMLGYHRRARFGWLESALALPGVRRREQLAAAAACEALEFVGLGHRAEQLPAGLALGEEKLVEIARALVMDPELMLLDEPAAGLNDAETERLAQLLCRLRDAKRTVLIVEHNMNLVMMVSDQMVVLNYGEKIGDGTPDEVSRSRTVIAAYLGGASF